MKVLLGTLIFCFLCIGNLHAQTAAPKFTSIYTNLNKDCKTIEGKNGTDDASDCKGVGGYRIYNWSAAAAQFFAVTMPKSADKIQLATESFDYNFSKIKVEWRMADGKPFAVIMRFNKYSEEVKEGEYFGKKIGERLVIKGLKGFNHIDFEVDSKTPKANEKARELADKAFLNK